MILRALAAAAVLALAGCAESVVAPPAEIQARAYAHSGPTSLTLYTVVNNRSDAGAHTALMINASQRVLWDPAGSFRHPHAPERNDVLFGITPSVEAVYVDFHARETFRVIEQTVTVPPEVAELALRLARENGAVGQARCTISTTAILARLPGFEGFPQTFYPNRAQEAFAARTGVQGRTITDDDADDNHGVLIRASRTAPPLEG